MQDQILAYIRSNDHPSMIEIMSNTKGTERGKFRCMTLLTRGNMIRKIKDGADYWFEVTH